MIEFKTFVHDDITFRYYDSETGTIPFFFQHGIGGNLENVISLFKLPPEVRLISFDFRAHGETSPIGDLFKFNLYSFGNDIIALMDHLQIPQAIVGGMSMGAAVGLNLAIRLPARLKGIVLYRAAWLDGSMTLPTISLFEQIVELIRGYGAVEGQKRFTNSEAYHYLLKEFPDTAKSMLSQFSAKKSSENIIRFETLPYQNVVNAISEISEVNLPTLIISTRRSVHPFEYGVCLSALIPDSIFVEATAKAVSVEKHIAESNEAINKFLLKIGV